jgi:uncharacterized membrane protein
MIMSFIVGQDGYTCMNGVTKSMAVISKRRWKVVLFVLHVAIFLTRSSAKQRHV